MRRSIPFFWFALLTTLLSLLLPCATTTAGSEHNSNNANNTHDCPSHLRQLTAAAPWSPRSTPHAVYWPLSSFSNSNNNDPPAPSPSSFALHLIGGDSYENDVWLAPLSHTCQEPSASTCNSTISTCPAIAFPRTWHYAPMYMLPSSSDTDTPLPPSSSSVTSNNFSASLSMTVCQPAWSTVSPLVLPRPFSRLTLVAGLGSNSRFSKSIFSSTDARSWTRITRSPTGDAAVQRYGAQCVEHLPTSPQLRTLILFGGVIDAAAATTTASSSSSSSSLSSSSSSTFVASNDVYTSADDGAKWTALPKAPWVPRSRMFASLLTSPVSLPRVDTLLYVIGGLTIASTDGVDSCVGEGGTTNPDGCGALSDVWVSATLGRHWYALCTSAPWKPRGCFAGAITPDGVIVVVGGMQPQVGGAPAKVMDDMWLSFDGGYKWHECLGGSGTAGKNSGDDHDFAHIGVNDSVGRVGAGAVFDEAGHLLLIGGSHGTPSSRTNAIWQSTFSFFNVSQVLAACAIHPSVVRSLPRVGLTCLPQSPDFPCNVGAVSSSSSSSSTGSNQPPSGPPVVLTSSPRSSSFSSIASFSSLSSSSSSSSSCKPPHVPSAESTHSSFFSSRRGVIVFVIFTVVSVLVCVVVVFYCLVLRRVLTTRPRDSAEGRSPSPSPLSARDPHEQQLVHRTSSSSSSSLSSSAWLFSLLSHRSSTSSSSVEMDGYHYAELSEEGRGGVSASASAASASSLASASSVASASRAS